MNNKELDITRLMELVKYLTLKGKKVRHFDSYITFNRTSLNLETPEGPNIEISNFRINFNGHHNKYRRSINVDYGFGNTTNKEMKPFMVLSKQNNSFYQYSFVSEEFRRLSNDLQLNQINQAITLYNSGTNWYSLSKSVLIEVSDANKSKFETFMNRGYGNSTTSGTWKYYFNMAITEAKNGNFVRLNKYHHLIFKDEIFPQDRISLLKKLVEEYWGDADFDGINESSLFMNLLSTCPESHKLLLYNEFLANSAKLYRDVKDKLEEINRLVLLKWLLQTFYTTRTELEINKIRQKMINIPENKIIPIIKSYNYNIFQNYGPELDFDFETNGIKLNKVEISYIEPNVNHQKGQKYFKPYILSDGSKLDGNFYKFDEIIGAYATVTRIEYGILGGSVYPFPAFAVFELDILLRGKVTFQYFKDMFDILTNVAGMIIPCFKILQGVKICANFISLGLGITNVILNEDLVKKIMKSNDDTAKTFIISYKFITTFYGFKNLRGAYKIHGKKLIMDYEALLDFYSLTLDAEFFSSLKKINDPDYIKIDEEIKKIKLEIKTIK